MGMRFFFIILIAICGVWQTASADQTDPRLDGLFAELRTGSALDADATIARIESIWSDSASDTVDVLFERAETSATREDFELALILLDHAIGLSPHFAEAYALRGVIRLRQDDQRSAIEDFSRVLELEPRHFHIRKALAGILLANDAKRDAYEMFQKALEWNPHDEVARRRARALRRDFDGQEI